MKKLMAVLCMIALLTTAILPALAEQNNGKQGQPPQMNQNQGGRNGSAPSKPGNNQNGKSNDNGTPPAKPDGDTSAQTNGQTPPAMPDQSSSGTSGQNAPAQPGSQNGDMNGQPADQSGNKPENAPQTMQDQDTLQKLVTDGKLSQTTYDAIQSYLKTNTADSGDNQQTPPAKPDGDTTTQEDQQTPPAKPDDNDDGKGPQGQNGKKLDQETLKAMLDAGVITEDEYNVLLTATSQPSDTNETTESTDNADTSDTENNG